MKIHIMGASGSGTTTLGHALARTLSLKHLDTDHYYWLPTTPPYKEKRPLAERQALLQGDMHAEPDVVVSGSLVGWGAGVENVFDLVVFLYLPTSLRLERLRQREIARYGVVDPAFLAWASQYDEGPAQGRSLAKHEAWLAQQVCPVLRLEKNLTVAERIANVIGGIARLYKQQTALRGNFT